MPDDNISSQRELDEALDALRKEHPPVQPDSIRQYFIHLARIKKLCWAPDPEQTAKKIREAAETVIINLPFLATHFSQRLEQEQEVEICAYLLAAWAQLDADALPPFFDAISNWKMDGDSENRCQDGANELFQWIFQYLIDDVHPPLFSSPITLPTLQHYMFICRSLALIYQHALERWESTITLPFQRGNISVISVKEMLQELIAVVEQHIYLLELNSGHWGSHSETDSGDDLGSDTSDPASEKSTSPSKLVKALFALSQAQQLTGLTLSAALQNKIEEAITWHKPATKPSSNERKIIRSIRRKLLPKQYQSLLKPQVDIPGTPYTVDAAIEIGDRKIAIEVMGPGHHSILGNGADYNSAAQAKDTILKKFRLGSFLYRYCK